MIRINGVVEAVEGCTQGAGIRKHILPVLCFYILLVLCLPTNLVYGFSIRKAWSEYVNNFSNKWELKNYPYQKCINRTSIKYKIPTPVIVALIKGESSFNPRAKSGKSCYGLMQINWPNTAKDLGFKSIDELFKPCKNINAGVRYLRQMLNRYNNDMYFALAAYNYGPGNIDKSYPNIPQGAKWYTEYIWDKLQRMSKKKTHKVLLAMIPKGERTPKPSRKIRTKLPEKKKTPPKTKPIKKAKPQAIYVLEYVKRDKRMILKPFREYVRAKKLREFLENKSGVEIVIYKNIYGKKGFIVEYGLYVEYKTENELKEKVKIIEASTPFKKLLSNDNADLGDVS